MKTKFKRKIISVVLVTMILLVLFFPSGNAAAVSDQEVTATSDQFNEELSVLLRSQDTTYFFDTMKMRIGSKALEIDGHTTNMDVAPEIANGLNNASNTPCSRSCGSRSNLGWKNEKCDHKKSIW